MTNSDDVCCSNPQTELPAIELPTIDTATLADVNGGAWPAWTYRVSGWIAQQDPSDIAAMLLM